MSQNSESGYAGERDYWPRHRPSTGGVGVGWGGLRVALPGLWSACPCKGPALPVVSNRPRGRGYWCHDHDTTMTRRTPGPWHNPCLSKKHARAHYSPFYQHHLHKPCQITAGHLSNKTAGWLREWHQTCLISTPKLILLIPGWLARSLISFLPSFLPSRC